MGNVFRSLSKPLRRAIFEEGLTIPTEPQEKAIPLIREGKNVLLIAPTGTGKTEAAILPILDALVTTPREGGIRFLYITPLRALNRDMLDRLTRWCRRLDIRLAVRHGDTEVRERRAQALAPPQLLITTPETLQAVLVGRRMRAHLASLRWVVVDETHELAGDKRGSQLSIALERLREVAGDFQVVGLSATIGSPQEVARFLTGGRPCEVVKVSIARSMELEVLYPRATLRDREELAERLSTYPEVAARLRVMKRLIDSHSSSLLFTNTRSVAETLASRFRLWDLRAPIGIHHGSLSKPSRLSTERELKEGRLKGIICTSSLELGIDIGALDLVLQYNSPRQVARLLQRVGRSGHRIGKTAKGVILTQDADDFLEALVICRRALEEKLEAVAIPRKPLDVLCHQLAGLLIERRRWTLEEVLSLLRRAHPFRDLREDELLRLLEYMSSRYPRLAFLSLGQREFLKPQRRDALFRYYFETLSMIPEETRYLVIEEESGTPIGLLDEAFVAEHGEVGMKFIERGAPWKILEIYRDRIYVRAEEDPAGAIPSWVGEEIPVPYEVAQEVGEIRRKVEEGLREGSDLEEIAGTLCREYPARPEELLRGLEEVEEQVSLGLPIPTDRLLTVEAWEGFVLLHCAFGLSINRTLSRILAHLLSEELGTAVGVQQDPYRIVLKGRVPPERIAALLKELPGRDLRGIAVDALRKTGIFKRRLLHAARKFGAIAKGTDTRGVSLQSLLEGFRETVVYEEAVRDVLFYDTDVEGTGKVLKRIASGEIRVVTLEGVGLSPIGRIGMAELGRRYDLIPPEKMKRLLLESARARLLGEARTLVCTGCWRYVATEKVMDLPERPRCPHCNSPRLGVLTEEEEKVYGLCERRRFKEEVPKGYKRILERALKSAELVEEGGRDAVLALAGRNLTLPEVREVLRKGKGGDLIEAVMGAERKALKRRFFVKRAPAREGRRV
jgi:ATP-dependent Lhr-like helicase